MEGMGGTITQGRIDKSPGLCYHRLGKRGQPMSGFEGKFKNLLVEDHGDGVLTCTLNRPEVHNALNLETIQEIRSFLESLAHREGLRSLIFTGAGEQAFASGVDISELIERGRLDALRRINGSLFREIERFTVPTIAAIRGYALGGGCELAMACDLRVCGESSRFGQPEVRFGIIPGAGATYRMPRLVGLGRARELIFTGRIIDAREALEIGLVNRVVPDEEVIPAARALAAEIAENSALAVRFAKIALDAAGEMSTDVGMALESSAQAVLFEDEEKRERMTAFLKRKKGKR